MSNPEEKKEKKPAKLENVAEETGELVGKGVKKAWSVLKSFGEGVADAVEMKEDQKDDTLLACSHCGASIPPQSNFCAKCGKEL